MKQINKDMKAFLKKHGIDAQPMYIDKGSMCGSWRLYNLNITWWGNSTLHEKLAALGFVDYDREPLDDFSGNGGLFSIFARLTKGVL